MTCVQSFSSHNTPKKNGSVSRYGASLHHQRDHPKQGNLHFEIKDLAEYISCSKEEIILRNQIVSKIREIAHDNWPMALVLPYGSFVTKLSWSISDLDFVILDVPVSSQQPLQHLFDLASGLNESGLFEKLDVITTAKIPLIKTVHSASGISCDICFGVQTGVESSNLTAEYLVKFRELKPLVLLLKYFLHQRGLNNSYSGGLSSYQALLLLINHLQLNEDQVPSQHRDLGQIFINFLEFYGAQFDYEKYGIRIKDGGAYFEKSERNWFNPKFPQALSIEDPHNPDCDLGRTVFAIDSVRQHFHQAFILLTSAVQSGSPNPLRSILQIDTSLPKFRKYVRSINKKRTRERSENSRARFSKISTPKKDQEMSQKA